MLAAIAMTPSAPVLVPGLAGVAAGEIAAVREAALTAARTLPGRWLAVGVGEADQVIAPDTRGSFAGYGLDLPVTLGPQAPASVSALPLCALWTGWLRGQVNPGGSAEVRVYDAGHDAITAADLGRRLLADIAQLPDPVGVLVVADGANTLSDGAPGGFDPQSQPVQDALDDALAAGDTAALARLPDGIVGRVAYQVLGGLAGSSTWTGRLLYRGAPFGVGYSVGVWHRSPDPR